MIFATIHPRSTTDTLLSNLRIPRNDPGKGAQFHVRLLEDDLLDREIFTTLEGAKILIEQWEKEYNQIHPHSAKNYRPPAPEAILTMATT